MEEERNFIRVSMFPGKNVPDKYFDEAQSEYGKLERLPLLDRHHETSFVIGYISAKLKKADECLEDDRRRVALRRDVIDEYERRYTNADPLGSLNIDPNAGEKL